MWTLDAAGGRSRLHTAGAIQYAEHSNAQLVTSTYLVNWTAPASASFGTVRFNVAGNAANGDVTNQGDFIYTKVDNWTPLQSVASSAVHPISPRARSPWWIAAACL